MSQNAIIPLLKQFRDKEISASELHDKLEKIVQFCERKQTTLDQVRILAADLGDWEKYLKPALELAYKALISAAKLGQEYALNPVQEIAEAIVFAFVQIDKATIFIEKYSGCVSAETQSLVKQAINTSPQDDSEFQKIQHGQAQTIAAIFND